MHRFTWLAPLTAGAVLPLTLHRGQLLRVPPVQKTNGFLAREGGAAEALPRQRRLIVGTPRSVRRGLEALAEEYGAEEVLVVNIVYDHAARRRSYELMAGAFGLPRMATETPAPQASKKIAAV